MIVPDIQIKYYLLIPYIVGKEFVNWPLDLPEKKTPTKSDINMMLRSKFIKKKLFQFLWLTFILKDIPWVLMVDFLRGVPLFRQMTRTLQEFPYRVYVLLLASHLSGLKKQIQNTWKFDIFDSHLT